MSRFKKRRGKKAKPNNPHTQIFTVGGKRM